MDLGDDGRPHNAYLEILLDSGIIGFVIIVGLHLFIWVYAIRLFMDRGDPLCTSVGGVCLALLTGHLASFVGGQSFYAEEIDVGLWCAIGMMLRVYLARAKERSVSFVHADNQGYGYHSSPSMYS